MGFPLLTTEQVAVSAVATAADGSTDTNAKISFGSADNGIITVVDNGDGTALVQAGGAGTTQVIATATDPSGNTISASADVDVSEPAPPPNDATAVAIAFGTPEPKP
jgi:hypothetical protein